MKQQADGRQMRDVWRMAAAGASEKVFGKHPTQKPIKLLERIVEASTKSGDWILDPFAGSSTTGIAANLHQRNYVGIEKERQYIELSISRREDLRNETIF